MKTLSRLPAQTARRSLSALTLVALGGCTTLASDGGFGPIEQVAKERLGREVKWTRSDADREIGVVLPVLGQPVIAKRLAKCGVIAGAGRAHGKQQAQRQQQATDEHGGLAKGFIDAKRNTRDNVQ